MSHQEEHRDESRERRARVRVERFPVEVREELLIALAFGAHLNGLLQEYGVTSQALWGAARADGWIGELDAALWAGRDRRLRHGTSPAYRAGCRCSDCRAAKHPTMDRTTRVLARARERAE